MAKPARPEFEFHYVRRTMDEGERRRSIRQGFHDFQHFGWAKDPPFPAGDPRRWLWQNGAEEAERVRTHGDGAIERAQGWA